MHERVVVMAQQEKKVLIPVEFQLAKVMEILQNPPEGLRMYPITKRPEIGIFIDSMKMFPHDKVRFDLTIGSGVANVDVITLKLATLKTCCGPVYYASKTWYVFILLHESGQTANPLRDGAWWGRLYWGQNLMAGEICAEGQPQGRLFDLFEGLKAFEARPK